MYFIKFDGCEVAAIEGSRAMIWSDDGEGWVPPGGSEDMARAIRSDERAVEISGDRLTSVLSARGADFPNFAKKDFSRK
jgi:hypothetical protein